MHLRYFFSAVAACFWPASQAQALDFYPSSKILNSFESTSVKKLLDGEPGFSIKTVSIAKVLLNDDSTSDLLILFKKPSDCAIQGCEAHVLLSHIGPSGAAERFKSAYANRLKKIDLGPLVDGRRALKIDGKVHVWDGKSFRRLAI